jgi:DNA/RNA endonuclease YhcR with UshA esterase domain
MQRRSSAILVIFAITMFGVAAANQGSGGKKLTPAEAKDHIGEQATVCGKVVNTHYASSTRGQSTFLNLDAAHPNQVFSIVIRMSARSNFVDPGKRYSGKQVCITGLIRSYRGAAGIVVSSPEQIKEQPPGAK